MRKSIIKKSTLVFLTLILLLPNTIFGIEQSSVLEPPVIRNATVHDPSIIKDAKSGTYYVFGSHIAAAKSTDLISWDNFTNGYNTPNNTLFGDLSKTLAGSFKWAGENDSDSRGGFAVWAPDIFWNQDYINEDGTTGAYMMYYSVSSTYIRSAIGIAVAKDIEGPYQYVDTIMYSGFTNNEAYDRNSTVNKHWQNTNLSKLIADGVISGVNPAWFTSTGAYNNKLYTNAIDANILYDENGKLWMTYGSWSGGTFILELDKQTGQPKYPGVDGQTADGRMIDRYFGTKIASGYGRSAEATYAVYDKESDYYYLYITYGGLAADGGYQMRQFRSKTIEGPYADAKGNAAVFPASFDVGVGNFPSRTDHKDIGNKMIGNFLFKRDLGEAGTGIGTGYKSPGHNSYYIDDETGKQYLVTHTRFPQQGEMHEVRVHQTFKNSAEWPVPTPYRYAGETIAAVSKADVAGDYKYVNHGKEITGDLTESTWVKLNADNTITGAVTGTWKLYDNYRAELVIDNEGTYDGVFIRQYDPTSESWVMTFSAMSDQGIVIWGSHVEASSDQELVQAIKKELTTIFPANVISNLTLPTVATRGSQIAWASSNPEVVANDGTVTRPKFGSDNATVELTASITLGEVTDTQTITVTVLAEEQGGLAAYYDFSNGLKDRSGNQTEATVTGDRLNNTGGEITFEEGVVGQAAKFDGKSGIRLGNGLITGDTYSVSLWLKPEAITEFTTSFFGARTENNWISVVPKTPWGNTMVWSHNGDQWYDAVTDKTIPAGEWSHLTFTVNKGKAEFYINGVKKYTGTNFPNVFTSLDAVFGLGVNYWDVPFKGLMDEVRVYDGVALPEKEIQALYQNPDGLTAQYNFEDNLEDQTANYTAGTITGNSVDNTGGAISYVDGVTGKAAVFNGQSGVRLPNGLLSSNSYSVSFWLNPQELTQHTTTFFGARTNSNWLSLVPFGPGAGDTMVWSGSDPWYDATTGMKIPTNKWTHMAFTVNNGEMKVYVNGEQAFTGQNFPNLFTTADGVFALGVNYWDTPYKGLMDDLKVYGNTVLSGEEVKAYYSSLAGTEEPGTGDPGTEEPGTGDPGTEEPGTGDPGTEEPGTGDPGTEEPGTGDPGTEEPGTEAPGTGTPVTEQPGTEQPVLEQPETEALDEGNELPDTATNQFNLLALGFLIIVAGSAIYFILRKKKNILN
ncbi:LamG-like jellyroll fold domain-containing protein [Bacillus sp. MRMR6]|uniref:LamG-like jellyroll fold domain-containing protein n=1 Tax=Bacillus sp. MRMR6 TaxID=1928617 RepID=UPI0009FA98B0|nr:LamG-like jellyroll fold domain-containing protein [Bacillus sp. MRMR6]